MTQPIQVVLCGVFFDHPQAGVARMLFPAFLRRACRFVALISVVLAAAFSSSSNLSGQTFQGRALDGSSNAPLSTVLVRLVTESGNVRGITITDMGGFYSIEAPYPGTYYLEGSRLGYDPYHTQLIEVTSARDIPPINLLLSTAPIPIESLVVSTEPTDQWLRSLIDSSRGLLEDTRNQLEARLGGVPGLREMLGWSSPNRLTASSLANTPCFPLQSRDCLALYLRSIQIELEFSVQGLDGVFESYDERGQLQARATYKDGKLEGRWE